MIDALQWPAMVIALAGSFLVGSKTQRVQMLGWVCFLLSNLMWIAWAAHAHAIALLIMQMAFCVSSIRGFMNTRR